MLKHSTLSWNARQLSKMMDKKEVSFDNAIQRRLVWKPEKKSLLIHSTIYGYPIPPMYAVENNGKADFLDGKQRCNCIKSYLDNDFALVDVPEVTLEDGTVVNINGMFFKDLPEELQDRINTTLLSIIYYKELSDEEEAELFYRLNNGAPLSAIEHMRCTSPSLKTIQKIGQHELFTTALTQKAFEKYTHEDLVIKSYIMLTSNAPSLDNKTVRPVMETANFTEEIINNLNKIYDRILVAYKEIIKDVSVETGKLSKKIAKRILTRTHMLSIIPITKRSIEEGISDEVFTLWLKNFFCGSKSATKYDTYNSRSSSGSNHAESIKVRFSVIKKDYEKFISNNKNLIEKKEAEKETVEVIESIEVKEEVAEMAEEITKPVEFDVAEATVITPVETAAEEVAANVDSEVVSEESTEKTEEIETAVGEVKAEVA